MTNAQFFLITIITILLAIFVLKLVKKIAYDYLTFSKTSPKTLGLKQEKQTHLHFYFHDIVSGEDATCLHVAGPKPSNSDSSNFGAVAVIDDPLTVGPEPTSERVGRAQGMYSVSSQSEIGLLMVLNFVFTEGEYKGSTLSVLGHDPILKEVREMPIVGGSGAFRFARGYAEARTHMFNPTSLNAIVEYNVYAHHY